ncbi:MAG TPA: DNA polymerase III subunit chi [Burkholderiales bacterium]|nr:DNA polymerase III subunit chi [Burkholderiales bacterium]
MTQIDFYSHADNKLQVACGLCAKALERDARVMVYTADSETSDKLDKLMWCHPAIGFIPHCRAADRLAEETPVIIDHIAEPLPHDEILINLRSELAPFFSRFQRLIEIVSMDKIDSQAGRERFRFYRDRGYEIHHYDLSQSPGIL